MKHARFSLAVALLLGVASVASADPYNQSASSKATNQQAMRRSYRSNSYAPRMTNQPTTQAAPATAVQAPAAPVQTQAPAMAQPRVQQTQPQPVAQTAPSRAYRSYSYNPYGQFNNVNNEPTWTGLGKNGDHYYSRADNKVFSRGGSGW